MRWARYRTPEESIEDDRPPGPPGTALVEGDRILALDVTPRKIREFLEPLNTNIIIATPEQEWRALVEQVMRRGQAYPLPLDSVELMAPFDPVGDVVAIGRNYSDHAAEMVRAGRDVTERPTVFSKAHTSVNGPVGLIEIDARVSTEVDWEAELGVVIGVGPSGRTCRDVSPGDALDFVFGYTVVNDISARDIQYAWGGQFYKGKSIDGYCPIGPWIVTKDEVPDPQNLDITLRVNGEIKQSGNTAAMIFPVADLISQLSMGQTLRPGTLIATGTPPGVGYAREPKEFLRPGDVMETEIGGIGAMRNRVVAPETIA